MYNNSKEKIHLMAVKKGAALTTCKNGYASLSLA